ncbi:Peroxisomal membrane protein PEX16 [Termitomyces sp. J132]|nr:Peroxisomal membrane protein PEX16 [Termitomyces sp. J132]
MSMSIARYEAFLLDNVSTISSLESSLRSITWFLPGRFKDAELASETLTSLLNVMSMYHDTLLAKIVQKDRNYQPLIPPSLHTRFTKAWSDKSDKYKWAARALQLIKFLELVVEMGLRRKVSSKARWRGVILLEVVKACLRFTLLLITRKPLLSPPIPERDFDPASLPTSTHPSSETPSDSTAIPDHLRNNHTPLPPHALLSPRSETTAEDYLLPKAMSTSSVRPSLSLVKSLSSPTDWIAESIYIMRPLVYATLLVSDRRSSRPLIVALAMELLSRNLRRTPPLSAVLERTEYARRDRDMLWYLLRGSIWQSYTRPKLQNFAVGASHTPLFNLFGAFIQDWIPLIDEYYYYTAP